MRRKIANASQAIGRMPMRLLPLLALVVLFAVPAHADDNRRAQWVYSPDGRTQVVDATQWPYRSVVYLQSPSPQPGYIFICTGAFIGPNVVLTAAHCLYSASTWGGYTPSVTVVPALNGGVAPFGYQAASKWFVPSGWAANEPPGGGETPQSAVYDFGIVVLPDATLGSTVGALTVASLTDATLGSPSLGFGMIGYDGDKPTGTMWNRFGTGLAAPPTTRLEYAVSANHGSSGAPVLRRSDGLLIGINQGGSDTVSVPNFGRRVDAGVLAFLSSACLQAGCTYSSYVEPVGTATPQATAVPAATPTPLVASPTPRPTATPTPATGSARSRVFVPAAMR